MNRQEEYATLAEELKMTPEGLQNTVDRAMTREIASRKKRRGIFASAAGLAACFAVFVLLVNFSVPFAQACGRIPLVRELAKAVAWSPSLSAAVENAYVQPIGQRQTVNGITATIEYVIVDQKQLNIFFTLNSADYDNLSSELPKFSEKQMCSVIGADFNQPPGTLLHYTMDYVDQDVPDSLTMTFGVTTWTEPNYTEIAAPESVQDHADQMLEPIEEPDQEILAEFTFTLRIDPDFTAPGEIIPIDTEFRLDGQTLQITDVEIYPTHVRVNVTADQGNTAWLKGLEFYLENERGERFDPISNGISASGDEDTPMMISYRLESPYFADCRRLTLHITGGLWLDKDMERIRVDLPAGKAEKLPEGVTLYRAEERSGGWFLTFHVLEEENHHRQVFGMQYYDGEGALHESSQSGFTSGIEGVAEEQLPLQDFHEDVVWLCPTYSRSTTEPIPITIPIK